jgi:hypothetical protein
LNENAEKKNHINRNRITALESISATNQKRIVSHPLTDAVGLKLFWKICRAGLLDKSIFYQTDETKKYLYTMDEREKVKEI